MNNWEAWRVHHCIGFKVAEDINILHLSTMSIPDICIHNNSNLESLLIAHLYTGLHSITVEGQSWSRNSWYPNHLWAKVLDFSADNDHHSDFFKNNIELISLGLDTVATSEWLRSPSAKTCRQKNYKIQKDV